MEALQDCFECTDWDVFKAAATDSQHTNVAEYAQFVSAYIQKGMEDVPVTKNITIWVNMKLSDQRDACSAQITKWHFKSSDMVEQQEPTCHKSSETWPW